MTLYKQGMGGWGSMSTLWGPIFMSLTNLSGCRFQYATAGGWSTRGYVWLPRLPRAFG